MQDFALITDDLQRIAQASHILWDIPADADYQLINLSENATFKVQYNPVIKILRINRVGYHSSDAILSEIAWIEALQRDNIIITADILHGKNGKKLQCYDDNITQQQYHMLLFEFLTGHHLNEHQQLPKNFYHLGNITAKLHLHSQKFAGELPSFFTRLNWDFDGMIGANPHWGAWQHTVNNSDSTIKNPSMSNEAIKLLTRTTEKIKSKLYHYGQSDDNYGLIHADLRLANFLIEGDKLKVLDFDDCGFSWFLYDIGAAFSFIENHPEKPEIIEAWLAGYLKTRHLTPDDIAMIPCFIMLRKMVLLGWIGSHATTLLAAQQSKDFTTQACLLAEEFLSSV
ncbi:MAG: phosphotransferase [Alphaproteobacteria bacterium]|nr:phosphotransferase [Alphaproteobacteria bacterium]